MSVEELQSIGSGDDRSRESSLASLADDLTKRSTVHHRLGLGLDRALGHLHGKLGGDGVPTAASPAASESGGGGQFLSTAAATASGAASGFGSFRVPIQKEDSSSVGPKLSSLAEGDAGDAEDDRGQPPAAAVSDTPILQVCVVIMRVRVERE